MTRVRRDLDDEDMLDAVEAKDIRAERAEESERLDRMQKAQAEAEASRRVDLRGWFEKANHEQVLATYTAAKVSPPEGFTLVSLSMLMTLGWKIDELPNGERVLVQPPAPPVFPSGPPTRGYQITTPEPKKPEGKKQ